MKKTDKRIRSVTSRESAWGRPKGEITSLVEKMRPKRNCKIGGVSDLHIEIFESITEDEIEEMELHTDDIKELNQ
jgi:hypothetical protein